MTRSLLFSVQQSKIENRKSKMVYDSSLVTRSTSANVVTP